MLIEKLVVGPVQTNCYIYAIKEGSEGIVVDPGDCAEKILSRIAERNLTIVYIVLTHCHFDHIGAVERLRKETGAKVVIHAQDAEGLYNPKVSLAALVGMNTTNNPADICVQDMQQLRAGEMTFTVLHTPGHTRGGICLLHEKTLFSGDTLFAGNIGRCDLPGGSLPMLTKSISQQLMCLSDEVEVYPGHGEKTSIGNERNNNPYVS